MINYLWNLWYYCRYLGILDLLLVFVRFGSLEDFVRCFGVFVILLDECSLVLGFWSWSFFLVILHWFFLRMFAIDILFILSLLVVCVTFLIGCFLFNWMTYASPILFWGIFFCQAVMHMRLFSIYFWISFIGSCAKAFYFSWICL